MFKTIQIQFHRLHEIAVVIYVGKFVYEMLAGYHVI